MTDGRNSGYARSMSRRTSRAARMLACCSVAALGGWMPAIAEDAVRPVPPFAVDVDPIPDADADVQIALLLDTSNSMDGLIHQARTQLWTIVNELNRAKRDGKLPRVQVALYEYGNNNIPAGEGHVRQVVGFTTDLDMLAEKLFALTTNGGEEFCGQVIKQSVNGLNWSRRPNTYRAIFIAGNEPFTQGSYDYRESVAWAQRMSIRVNTIHCGDRESGVAGMWEDGAKLGRGQFMFINQNRHEPVIDCPQDASIQALNLELNATYLAYGKQGGEGMARQAAQDANAAAAAPAVIAERAASKVGGNYDNSHWDLLDAIDRKSVKLEEIADSDLPEVLRPMSDDERAAHLSALRSKREAIQNEIAKLAAERAIFYNAERERLAREEGDATETLESATIKLVRAQMSESGFTFE